MDIIDVMLAKAMTPQGKTDAYVAKANRAAQRAAQAEADAAAAVAAVAEAAEDIADKKNAADTLLAEAQDALETAQQAQINMPEAYGTTGQNTDGYMTQKAVTDMLSVKANTLDVNNALAQKADVSALAAKADANALALKADAATTATKTYVDEKIAAIPNGGGGNITIEFDPEDANHLVKVDDNGHLVASVATEEAIVEALLRAGTYVAKNAVGLDIDYANRVNTRTQEAVGKSMGSDFNSYPMYGGRVKCNVADDGTINAFYGEPGYAEDGSNGQVMIYQPKFYYKRIIRVADELIKGKAIRHEALMISATEQAGFKLAPAFAGDLDYILLPAYDAGLVNDKLVSIAGVTPINNVTAEQAEAYARARGTGWHIMNMAAESANQMLEIVEFGTMNGQSAIEQGITYIPYGSNGLCLFITGSTASLGNGTGHAESTQYEANGVVSTATDNGYRAIAYRGMENPWGNLWSMIGGVNVVGNYNDGGGKILICQDFNYSGENYEEVGFNLPSEYGWINAMGYGSEDYDWVYLPVECSVNANSVAPVGDSLWTVANLVGTMKLATGGSFGYTEACGPFYYAADRDNEDTARSNYGAKLLYIPTKNATYTANVAKWNTLMGG